MAGTLTDSRSSLKTAFFGKPFFLGALSMGAFERGATRGGHLKGFQGEALYYSSGN